MMTVNSSEEADLPGIKVEWGVSSLSPGIHIGARLNQDLNGAQVIVGAGKMQSGVAAKAPLLNLVNIIHFSLLDHGLQSACVADTCELKTLQDQELNEFRLLAHPPLNSSNLD